MLTNQISTGRFRLVVFIACGLLRAMAALYKSEQVLPVSGSRVSMEQSLFTCAVENVRTAYVSWDATGSSQTQTAALTFAV